MRTRKAILPDAQPIHDLISAYSHDGTLLPRTIHEICENVRDFVVLEDEGRIIGAIHPHAAIVEIQRQHVDHARAVMLIRPMHAAQMQHGHQRAFQHRGA